MKALENSNYSEYEVAEKFNNIILNHLEGYDGTKKEKLKSFLEDMQKGGCQSGLIGEFTYNASCKEFYIKYIDDLEDIKAEFEEGLGEAIQNRQSLPHYTFMCWLCFEEYCYRIYSNTFED